VVGLARSKDPENCAGGSVATDRISHAARDVPLLQSEGWDEATSSAKNIYVEKTSKVPPMGLKHRRRSGCTEKKRLVGEWRRL